MKWLLVSPKDRRRAATWAALAFTVLLAAVLAGSLSSPSGALFWGTTGFGAFVLCLRKAIAFWRVDEMVFDHRAPWNPEQFASARSGRKLLRAGMEQSWRSS